MNPLPRLARSAPSSSSAAPSSFKSRSRFEPTKPPQAKPARVHQSLSLVLKDFSPSYDTPEGLTVVSTAPSPSDLRFFLSFLDFSFGFFFVSAAAGADALPR